MAIVAAQRMENERAKKEEEEARAMEQARIGEALFIH